MQDRKCRVCGCTQEDCRQCIEKTGTPCHWVEDNLCSACVMETQHEPVRYSESDLQSFKAILLDKKDAAEKELLYLRSRINEPLNPDTGQTWEQEASEHWKGLISRQTDHLHKIGKALERIENKTYGVCRVTGKLIDKARLNALPVTELSLEGKEIESKAETKPFKENGAIAAAIQKEALLQAESEDETPAPQQHITTDTSALSPEAAPVTITGDAYQEHVNKVLSQPKFEAMNFFAQLHKAGNGADLSIDIKEKNGKYTIMLLPKAGDKSRLQPLIMTGTPEELDAEFFPSVGPVLSESTMKLVNAEAFRKRVDAMADKYEKKKGNPPASAAPEKKEVAPKKGKSPTKAAAKKAAPRKAAQVPKVEESKPKVQEESLFD